MLQDVGAALIMQVKLPILAPREDSNLTDHLKVRHRRDFAQNMSSPFPMKMLRDGVGMNLERFVPFNDDPSSQ